MRKLASIQRITAIEPIEGADNIELVKVLGWQCVAKKGEFQECDSCVYFELDSFLPIKPEFEFLRASCYKKNDLMGEGFKLRTLKFRGQISQGLCLPITILDEADRNLPVGTDVSEILGVRKYEIPEMATTGGNVIGELPSFVPHTDEVRIQAEPKLFDEFKGLPYYITTKCDGSSHSVAWDKDGLHVTGHNYEYKDDGSSSFYEFVKKKNLGEKLKLYCELEDISTIVIQGEYVGPGIQKNRMKLKAPDWFIFNVEIEGKRQGFDKLTKISGITGCIHVPIEETGNDLTLKYPNIEYLLKRAEGEYFYGGQKEGIVIRPQEPVQSDILRTYLSMKVINNKYLLKNKD